MKKTAIISVLLSSALLTGCGSGVQNKSEKGNGEVIVSPTVGNEISATGNPRLVFELSETTFQCFGKTFYPCRSELDCSCDIWDDSFSVRTSYRKKDSAGDIPPEYIAELVTALTSGDYETVSSFSGDHNLCLDNVTDGISIMSGMADVYGYDELDNAVVDKKPAFSLTSGGDTITYLVPSEMKKEFDEIIERAIVSDENIRDIFERPDRSYQEITDKEYPKDLILLVDSYSNYAEEPVSTGRFIDEHGYVYSYDLSGVNLQNQYCNREGIDGCSYDEAFIDALYYDVYYKTEPFAQVDQENISDIYTEFWGIDPESEMELTNMACDMGQFSLSFIDPQSMTLVKLRTDGDNKGILDDEYAKDICEKYDALEFINIE